MTSLRGSRILEELLRGRAGGLKDACHSMEPMACRWLWQTEALRLGPLRMYRWLFKRNDVAHLWNNKHLSSLYINCVKSLGVMPMRLRTDLETENETMAAIVYPPCCAHGLRWLINPVTSSTGNQRIVMVVFSQEEGVYDWVCLKCTVEADQCWFYNIFLFCRLSFHIEFALKINHHQQLFYS